jgi:hypothetical protein
MKSKWKITVLAFALALITVLVLAYHSADIRSGNKAYYGEKLAIKGKVYTVIATFTDDGPEYALAPYSGKSLVISMGDIYDGKDWVTFSESGTISKKGELNLSIKGAPANIAPIEELFTAHITSPFQILPKEYENFSISADDVKAAHLVLTAKTGEQEWDREVLYKRSSSPPRRGYAYENIGYWYVDKDVRITGQGTTTSAGSGTVTTSDLDLQLKKGWNAVHHISLRIYNEGTSPIARELSCDLGDSSDINWILGIARSNRSGNNNTK